MRRRLIRRALRQAVHLGELLVEVSLPCREQPRGVVGGVRDGGVDEGGQEARELGRVRRDICVEVDGVRVGRRAGAGAGEGEHVGVMEDALVVVDGAVHVVGAVVRKVSEGLSQAGEAVRGVDVAAAERHGPELLRDGADDGGGEEGPGRGGVLGQRGRDEVEMSLVCAVRLEVVALAAHWPRVSCDGRRHEQCVGGGENGKQGQEVVSHSPAKVG